MPDVKRRAELDLENQRYIAAAQQVIAEDAQLATSLGRVRADLDREFLHVSYAVQDFTSVMGTQGQGRAFAAIQNNANANAHAGDPQAPTETDFQDINVSQVPRGESVSESERMAAHEAHDEIDMGKIQRDAQAKSDREPAAKRKRQRTEQGKDIRDDDDQIANARWAAQNAKNQESRQAKDEAQAVMAQLSARIDQLSAQQRQLHGNWRRLRMEDQNRTQQNMGGN